MRAIIHALSISGSMTWEITWALILGFALSAVIQAVVRRSTVVRLLGDARPRTLVIAAGLGAASSSCSYAAVALARALFRKGADFTAAMAFEIASTNLVIELGVILALLMGWQFTLAEFTGGPLMIVILAVLFRLFLRGRLLARAREQADRGLSGSMEGHAAMDMSVQREGSFARRLLSREGFTSVSHVFVMEWAAIIRDLVIGLLVAGAIAAWVPDRFWRAFFFAGHPLAAKLWGPLIGPVVAVLSFVCSVGNVPLAVVLWKGGISFGGVVAFIFADLIIAPVLNIYRKYYGPRMAAFLFGTFFAAMAGAGYVIELVFGGLGLVPDRAGAKIADSGVSWDYTTWLNIIFLLLAAALIIRFARTGGGMMLRMMGGTPAAPDAEPRHGRALPGLAGDQGRPRPGQENLPLPRWGMYDELERGGGVHGYTPDKDEYLKRLRRIEGQVRGLQKMVDDDKYCIDILTQVSAVTSALQSVALGLLEDHLGHCVAQAAAEGGDVAEQKVREASDAIARLVRS